MRMKVLAILVAGMLVSACGTSSQGPGQGAASSPGGVAGSTQGPGGSSAPGGASAPAGEVVRITVGTDAGADLRFEPAEVSVPAGSSVELTFQNQATVPHNLTFQGAITAATATTVEPGASDTVEFQAPAPGSYPFVCTLHPGMEGTLVVTAS